MSGVLRSLYICYLSLEDPLVQTQVVAYLAGLAERGHTIHLLTYEPKLTRERKKALSAQLADRGIAWHSLRYHKRPSLPATFYDAVAGAIVGTWLVRRKGLDAVHARSHVPAASGLIVRRLSGRRLIFDLRGLLADEYADAGRWRRDGLAYRITTWIQGVAIARSDAVVMLTERVRRHLFGGSPPASTEVIPCCVELGRVQADSEAVARLRTDLGLERRPVMVYVGKLTAPYMDREMAEFFATARRSDPSLAFVVVTQAPPETIAAEFDRLELAEADYRITRCEASEIGAYLGLADFAICFCRPTFARIASSPTKIAEYLGAGLPVVSGPDIGDVDEMLTGERVGVIAEAFDDREYDRTAVAVREMAADPVARDRCIQTARASFSLEEVGIPRYDALYRRLAGARERSR
jgi:glycosyltransferase involved in cell wall biosynthesis